MPGIADWLERGCAPGRHQLAALPTHGKPVSYVCLQCGRCELPGGLTCVLCERDGTRPTVLLPPGDRAALRGLLCDGCAAEFVEAGAIFGWTVRPDGAAAGVG